MSLSRVTIRTLLALGGFALVVPNLFAQQDLPSWPSAEARRIRIFNGVRGGIPQDNVKEAKQDFKKFADYFAAIVEHPATWKASQDLKTPVAGGGRMALEGEYGVFKEIDRFLQEPVAGNTKVGPDQAAYIREFGAALDESFKKLIEGNGDRIVRMNAARVYAHFARTGAPAHFPSLTAMLSDSKIPVEVKYYLLQAAAAALAAADINDLKLRKHAVPVGEVSGLVKILIDFVNDPAKLQPGYNPDKATEDERAVAGLLRRQVVRALAQVKFVRVPAPDGKGELYPSYALVRVAAGDPALKPEPGPAEVAEAAIGILNMAPVEWKVNHFVLVSEYNPQVALEAVAQAILTFASPRATDPFDRTLPWRNYALRLAEALSKWKSLFDPNLDLTQPNKVEPKGVPARFDDMYKEVVPKVLARIEKVDSSGKPTIDPVEVEVLRRYLGAMRDDPKRETDLFKGVKETSIMFPPAKK